MISGQYLQQEPTVLEVDSMVEVIDGIEHIGEMGIVGPVFGVIKWIGQLPGEKVNCYFTIFASL